MAEQKTAEPIRRDNPYANSGNGNGNGRGGDSETPAPATEAEATTPETETAAPVTEAPAKKRAPVLIIVGIAALIGIFYGVNYYLWSRDHVRTDDAYVTGNLVNISPTVGGTLNALNVGEGDMVKKGQLLARIDDAGSRAALAQAQAAYENAKTQVLQAEANLAFQQASTDAAIRRAQSALTTNQQESPRRRSAGGPYRWHDPFTGGAGDKPDQGGAGAGRAGDRTDQNRAGQPCRNPAKRRNRQSRRPRSGSPSFVRSGRFEPGAAG